LLERISHWLMREPEDREQLIELLHGAYENSLMDAADVLAGVRGLAFTHFQSEDVVRHPLVGRIVDAYAARRAETDK
jgi:phosphate starvation-inducible protein PhoH